jgi:glycosyltransferase involved in cell wall biosynthesis
MLIPDGFAAVTFGGMTKLPVVVTERGYLRTLIERSAGDRRALRLVLQKASEAVFVSASLQETAHQLAQPKRSSVVYTGLDSDRFTPSDRLDARRQLGLAPYAQWVLIVGQNLVKKGGVDLIAATSQLRSKFPEVRVAMVGSGCDAPEIRHAIQAHRLERVVHLVGRLAPHELPTWYNAADVYALPSYREGVPNSVLEAMCCGTAVVASNVDGMPEVIRDGETGALVAPGDPAQLARAVGEFLGNEALRRRIAVAGSECVRERFAWSVHGEQMLKVYRRAIDSVAH